MPGTLSSPSKTILIVEDRPVMQAMLCEFVRNAFPGYAAIGAGDGAQALEHCRRERPAVVLMDVQLPDANGIELTARLIALTPGLDVIVISSLSDAVYVEQALAAGARAFVPKDRLVTQLIPAMASLIDREGPGNSAKVSG